MSPELHLAATICRSSASPATRRSLIPLSNNRSILPTRARSRRPRRARPPIPATLPIEARVEPKNTQTHEHRTTIPDADALALIAVVLYVAVIGAELSASGLAVANILDHHVRWPRPPICLDPTAGRRARGAAPAPLARASGHAVPGGPR